MERNETDRRRTKLVIDYPIKYVHLLQGDITFALAQLYKKEPVYRDILLHLKNTGREIMLDNGAWEFGKSMNVVDYIHICEELQPTYAVVPDVMKKKKQTEKVALSFLEKWNWQNKTKLIFAPQGKNETELFDCYNNVVNKYHIYLDMVGIPKHIGKIVNRVTFTDHLYEHASVKFERVHFLGYWNWEELAFQHKYPWYIHSLDTKAPVKYAYRPNNIFSDQMSYYYAKEKIRIEDFEVAVNHFQYLLNGGAE